MKFRLEQTVYLYGKKPCQVVDASYQNREEIYLVSFPHLSAKQWFDASLLLARPGDLPVNSAEATVDCITGQPLKQASKPISRTSVRFHGASAIGELQRILDCPICPYCFHLGELASKKKGAFVCSNHLPVQPYGRCTDCASIYDNGTELDYETKEYIGRVLRCKCNGIIELQWPRRPKFLKNLPKVPANLLARSRKLSGQGLDAAEEICSILSLKWKEVMQIVERVEKAK
jgi:hypothetical protein